MILFLRSKVVVIYTSLGTMCCSQAAVYKYTTFHLFDSKLQFGIHEAAINCSPVGCVVLPELYELKKCVKNYILFNNNYFFLQNDEAMCVKIDKLHAGFA